jgi:hypothetical protein
MYILYITIYNVCIWIVYMYCMHEETWINHSILVTSPSWPWRVLEHAPRMDRKRIGVDMPLPKGKSCWPRRGTCDFPFRYNLGHFRHLVVSNRAKCLSDLISIKRLQRFSLSKNSIKTSPVREPIAVQHVVASNWGHGSRWSRWSSIFSLECTK